MAAIPIVIVGAGGFGRECLDIIEAVNEHTPGTFDFLGFLDDGQPEFYGRAGATHLGQVDKLGEMDAQYVIGIGSGDARRQVDQATDRQPAVLVHPAATMAADVRLSPGTVITAGVHLTNHIELGRHVHLNLNVTVGHDAVLEDYVTVNPGVNISGNVHLEAGVTMGTGAAIIQGCRVGRDTTVGAGAVVVRDLPAEVTAVGVPAKALTR